MKLCIPGGGRGVPRPSRKKPHKFHQKGIIHLAYSPVLPHIVCTCILYCLPRLTEIKAGT